MTAVKGCFTRTPRVIAFKVSFAKTLRTMAFNEYFARTPRSIAVKGRFAGILSESSRWAFSQRHNVRRLVFAYSMNLVGVSLLFWLQRNVGYIGAFTISIGQNYAVSTIDVDVTCTNEKCNQWS